MTAVTLVGAGRIGLPIVSRLVAAGHDVAVVDIDDTRRHGVLAAGASWAGTMLSPLPTERVLITVLPGNAELLSVLPPDGPMPLERGGSWIDLTSTAPDVGARLLDAATRAGVRRIDAGIGGGPEQARTGSLTLYVGGEDAVVAAVRPLLETFACRVQHVGAPGTGHLVKLLINQLWFGQAVAVTEVLLLAASAGIAPASLAPLLADGPAESGFVRDYLPRLLDGDRLPYFELGRIVEELDSLQRAAQDAATPWAASGQVAQAHREALDGLGDRTEELAVVGWLEQLAGRRLH